MVDKVKYKAYDVIPVYAPAFGLAGNVPPTMLNKQYAANCLNVRFKNGEVIKRTGYVDYGTGTITGVPLGFYRYQRWDGTEYALLVTTTDVYKLESGAWVKLLDTIEDCEDAWNEFVDADVTSTADTTDKRVGSASAKLVVADTASAGDILATEAIALHDLSSATKIRLWIKCSVVTASGNLQLLLDNTAQCASPLEAINIPALTAGTWTEVDLTLANPASDTAIISVGLKYVTDIGACTIWVDEVRTIGTRNGSVDTRCSLCTIQNTLIHANLGDVAKKWDGTTWKNLGGAVNYKPSIVLPYGERLVMFNIIESDVPVPIRVRWSAVGTYETWAGTGSSFFDVTDGIGAKIVGAELMGNYVGVYKDYSISLMDYIGGASIFAIDVHINNMGLAARSAIVNLHTLHVFLGWDNVYAWNGGWKLQDIGNPIKDELFSEINNSKIGRSFMLHCPREHEIHLFVCLGTDDYPTRFWTYTYEMTEGEIKGVWSKGVMASISGAGSITTGGVERALIGLSGGGIEHYNYSTVNDDEVKIDGYFETPDFPISAEEYILEREMFEGFSAEAYGNTLTLSYSVDGGNSYTDMAAKTLQSTSLYKLEDWYFRKHGQQIRFKLRNNTVSETFRFRFYAIKVIPREAHK